MAQISRATRIDVRVWSSMGDIAPGAKGHYQLRLVAFQEAPGRWVARGLEHDIVAEAHTIGECVRAIMRLVETHTAFDLRHQHPPLSAFPPAPQRCWNFHRTGIPVPLDQLGIVPPLDWDVHVAVSSRNPS